MMADLSGSLSLLKQLVVETILTLKKYTRSFSKTYYRNRKLDCFSWSFCFHQHYASGEAWHLPPGAYDTISILKRSGGHHVSALLCFWYRFTYLTFLPILSFLKYWTLDSQAGRSFQLWHPVDEDIERAECVGSVSINTFLYFFPLLKNNPRLNYFMSVVNYVTWLWMPIPHFKCS